ncbi:MAG: response regulator transcription factor [Chitinophagaceae bacterium]|nr:MAG: response regulator transcription factor [Chitinophagaceae bacterium]
MSGFLENETFLCENAGSYQIALGKIRANDYAVIILDIGLPDGSGLDLLHQIKLENKAEGVIIVSAKDSVDDKVAGLQKGADDYLAKPFHLSELAARVTSIIRRKNFDGQTAITCNNLVVDLPKKRATVNEIPVDLTKKEFELLLYFLSNKNKVISKDAIAEHLWRENMDLCNNYDFIYTHVKNLRKKLVWAGCEDYLKSVYGMGYKFQQHD